jgi:hypothetical protein
VELSQPDLRLDGEREVVEFCGRWLHAVTPAGGTLCAESRLRIKF